jgi:hypothetical protein
MRIDRRIEARNVRFLEEISTMTVFLRELLQNPPSDVKKLLLCLQCQAGPE